MTFDPRQDDEVEVERMEPPEEDRQLSMLLMVDACKELASREAQWDQFSSGVDLRIAATLESPLPERAVAAIQSELDRELASREDAWRSFSDAVLGRISTAIEEELRVEEDNLGEIVRADVQSVLAQREGEWSGFAERVQTAEEETVAAFRKEVSTELSAMSPRFEGGAFRAQVEERIGAERPRVVPLRRPQLSGRARTIVGAVMAAAAVLLALVFTDRQPLTTGDAPLPSRGEVTVSEVSFEGTVTVMDADGVALIWLADAS